MFHLNECLFVLADSPIEKDYFPLKLALLIKEEEEAKDRTALISIEYEYVGFVNRINRIVVIFYNVGF